MESEPSVRRALAINVIKDLERFNDIAALAADPMTNTSYMKSLYEMERRGLRLGQIADERFVIQVRNGTRSSRGEPLHIFEWDSEGHVVNTASPVMLSPDECETFDATSLLKCESTEDLYYVDELGQYCVRYSPHYYLSLNSRDKAEAKLQ